MMVLMNATFAEKAKEKEAARRQQQQQEADRLEEERREAQRREEERREQVHCLRDDVEAVCNALREDNRQRMVERRPSAPCTR